MLGSNKPQWRLIVSIIVVLLILIISLNSTLRSTVQYFFGIFTKPLHNLTQDIGGRLQKKEEVVNENKELYERLAKITVDYSRLKSLEIENKNLRTELDYLQETDYDYQMADIISGTSLPSLDILIINKGQVHGIKEGMSVIHSDGIMIGKIYRVDKFTSHLLLINNNNSSVSAVVQNEESTFGVVNGRHNLSIIMEFIPQDQIVENGQTIVTSGREQYIPYGLVIGQITSVNKLDNDFFQSATIASPIKLSTIKQVVVLIQIDE